MHKHKLESLSAWSKVSAGQLRNWGRSNRPLHGKRVWVHARPSWHRILRVPAIPQTIWTVLSLRFGGRTSVYFRFYKWACFYKSFEGYISQSLLQLKLYFCVVDLKNQTIPTIVTFRVAELSPAGLKPRHFVRRGVFKSDWLL